MSLDKTTGTDVPRREPSVSPSAVVSNGNGNSARRAVAPQSAAGVDPLPTNGPNGRTGPATVSWARRFGRAWLSIHERLALEPLPLTTLVSSNGHAGESDDQSPSGVVCLSDNGSGPEYGIVAGSDSELSFHLRLGERPRFSTQIRFLTRPNALGTTEFLVDVEIDGDRHEVVRRSLKMSGNERRRRLSVDLGKFSGQDVVLVLRTRLTEGQREVPAVWANPRVISRRPLADRVVKLRREVRRLGMHGVANTVLAAMRGQLDLKDTHALYRMWVEKNRLDRHDIDRIRKRVAPLEYRPLISIVTPVHNTDPGWLRKCIDSVRGQLYTNWELCLADDASTDPRADRVIQEYVRRDPRIRTVRLPENQGIAGASNAALGLATGEFVGLLDHDDELSRDALYEVVALLQQKRDADVIYSDEDKLDPDGSRTQPFFKPDWSPEYLHSCMYSCHFSVYRKSVLDRLGGFRTGFDGSQDYDLMLRVTEHTDRIVHIAKILYHWRRYNGSAADSRKAKPYAHDAGRRALEDHVQRRALCAEVADGKQPGFYRLRYAVDPNARVSIVIPTKDNADLLRACIQSIESKTSHKAYEILIVDNDSRDPRATDYLATLPHPVIRSLEPFNFSRLNNFAASRATGDYLVFLNNDTEVITPDWLTAMLEFCQQPDIGAVGAKLLFPDGRIQHAGVTLGLGGGVAGHPLTGFPRETGHYFSIGNSIRNCSAVTGACMMTRREVFEAVGGFDESFPVAYNDVDFCLRVRKRGFRIVWTPYAELYHHESSSWDGRITSGAIRMMKSRWGKELLKDPYYNPNLSLDHGDLRVRL